MKNKKLFVILGSIIVLIGVLVGVFFFLLSPVSKSNKTVLFTVKNGEGKESIISNLKDANLVKSKYATILYVLVSGSRNFQAGSYEFSRDMSTQAIVKALNNGDVIKSYKVSARVTLKEGKTLKEFLKLICNEVNLDYDDAIKSVNDKEFLKELINDYWFLTEDILDEDIYYALEGYLFPETYDFYIDTNINQVIRKMLDVTEDRLEPLKESISKSKFNIHELLTIASIVEKEANTLDDRGMVSQVIYKRLELNMSLGMDVTSYYGVQKDMKEALTTVDLNDKNPYNTRVTTFIGLPVGPICNPSIESIMASLNPSETDYLYFVADINTGKVHFAKDINEFNELVKKYIK